MGWPGRGRESFSSYQIRDEQGRLDVLEYMDEKPEIVILDGEKGCCSQMVCVEGELSGKRSEEVGFKLYGTEFIIR